MKQKQKKFTTETRRTRRKDREKEASVRGIEPRFFSHFFFLSSSVFLGVLRVSVVNFFILETRRVDTLRSPNPA
jgi:hypothetical protein